jgi:hypothetical protein
MKTIVNHRLATNTTRTVWWQIMRKTRLVRKLCILQDPCLCNHGQGYTAHGASHFVKLFADIFVKDLLHVSQDFAEGCLRCAGQMVWQGFANTLEIVCHRFARACDSHSFASDLPSAAKHLQTVCL